MAIYQHSRVSRIVPRYNFARKSQLHAITQVARSSHTDREPSELKGADLPAASLPGPWLRDV
jgi:hypothetical protein